mmetsp:Transcript_7140/g.32240  ORF Transcript_7140/g.32240 Transcript_7140/m.32240 type:complete len:435 (+) Transcript_7140:1127-2431(+)
MRRVRTASAPCSHATAGDDAGQQGGRQPQGVVPPDRNDDAVQALRGNLASRFQLPPLRLILGVKSRQIDVHGERVRLFDTLELVREPVRVVSHRARLERVAFIRQRLDAFLNLLDERGSIPVGLVARRGNPRRRALGHLREGGLGVLHGSVQFLRVRRERSLELRLVRRPHLRHLGANVGGFFHLRVERRTLRPHLSRVPREQVLGLSLVTGGEVSGLIQKLLVVSLDLGFKFRARPFCFVLELLIEVVAIGIRGAHDGFELLGSLLARLPDRGLSGVLRSLRRGGGGGPLLGQGGLESSPLPLERRGGGFFRGGELALVLSLCVRESLLELRLTLRVSVVRRLDLRLQSLIELGEFQLDRLGVDIRAGGCGSLLELLRRSLLRALQRIMVRTPGAASLGLGVRPERVHLSLERSFLVGELLRGGIGGELERGG